MRTAYTLATWINFNAYLTRMLLQSLLLVFFAHHVLFFVIDGRYLLT